MLFIRNITLDLILQGSSFKMNRIGELLSLLILLLVSIVEEVQACTCFPTHPQQQYCKADFVIVATVKREEVRYSKSFIKSDVIPEDPNFMRFPIERKFKVRIHRKFKLPKTFIGWNKNNFLYTGGSGASCGVMLKNRVTYLLSGQISGPDQQLRISMCGWVQEYKTLNYHQKKGLNYYYKHNCNCSVQWCTYDFCNGPRDVDPSFVCKWEPNWTNDCYTKHGFCTQKHDGTGCHWKKNRKFKNCLVSNNEKFPWRQNREREIAPQIETNEHSPGFEWP